MAPTPGSSASMRGVARFFHVDRNGSLQVGAVLGPAPWSSIPRATALPPPMQSHLEALLPHGITQHGLRYLLSAPPLKDEQKELLIDAVRRAEAPHLPSRYESVFACETEAEARAFVTEYPGEPGNPPPVVWELDGESLFRGDMRLVGGGLAAATFALLFSNYSAGIGSDDPRSVGQFTAVPLWEHLLAPGARVVQAAA